MFITIFFILIALLIIVGLVWRFASERRSIPCPAWLAWMVEMDNPFTETNRASTIIEHLQLQPGMKVLDLGCGPGRLSIPLAQKIGPQGEVLAMDIQPAMLSKVQAKAQSSSLSNICFLQAGAGDGKLAGSQFDRAILVTVLGEIPAQAIALKEIFNALKPGGVLSVTEIVFDPHFQSRKSVTQLAQAAGFHEQAFFGNGLAYTLNLQKP